MSGWYRASSSGCDQVVHRYGCPNIRSARQWQMVSGWTNTSVIDYVSGIPWLRLCEPCANRLELPGNHPARSTRARAGASGR